MQRTSPSVTAGQWPAPASLVPYLAGESGPSPVSSLHGVDVAGTNSSPRRAELVPLLCSAASDDDPPPASETSIKTAQTQSFLLL